MNVRTWTSGETPKEEEKKVEQQKVEQPKKEVITKKKNK